MEIGNIASLTNLWLKSNQLTGGIPDSLGTLTNLVRVRISGNTFDDDACLPGGLAAVANNDYAVAGLAACQ